MFLKDFTMLQTFMAAVATTQFYIILSSFLPGQLGSLAKSYRAAYVARRNDRGVLSVAIGGTFIGVGMVLAGACPGTIYVQLGSAVPASLIVFLGCILGVLAMTYLEKFATRCIHDKMTVEGCTLGEVARVPYLAFTATSVAVAASVVAASSLFLPNSKSSVVVDSSTSDGNVFTMPAWNPALTGTLIGTLQIPSILFTGYPLGMSSNLIALLSPFATYILSPLGLLPPNCELSKWKFPSWRATSKILNFAMVLLGSFTSAYLSGVWGQTPGLTSGIPPQKGGPYVFLPTDEFEGVSTTWPLLQALLGGFFLFFGARMGGGCTSGHGISGFSFLVP
ncbi:hypothetical protein HK102_008904, partial [Quaeritorhiza haematococci]